MTTGNDVTNDSGKHSALRQTGEGSFELVTDDEGLHEISESEASFAEETPPKAAAESSSGPSRLVFVVAGVIAAVVVAIAVGWALSGSSDDDSATGEAAEEPAGFKPYAGGPEEEQPTRRRQPEIAAAEAEEEPEPSEEETADEEDPGWELSDDGIVVEDEGEPDEEEQVEEITEDEEIPPEVLAEAKEELKNSPRIRDQKRLETIRQIGERIPSPNAPSLGKTPSIYGNVRKPKVRRIDPSTGTLKTVQTDDEGPADLPGTNGGNY
jgi:hypothetical protein